MDDLALCLRQEKIRIGHVGIGRIEPPVRLLQSILGGTVDRFELHEKTETAQELGGNLRVPLAAERLVVESQGGRIKRRARQLSGRMDGRLLRQFQESHGGRQQSRVVPLQAGVEKIEIGRLVKRDEPPVMLGHKRGSSAANSAMPATSPAPSAACFCESSAASVAICRSARRRSRSSIPQSWHKVAMESTSMAAWIDVARRKYRRQRKQRLETAAETRAVCCVAGLRQIVSHRKARQGNEVGRGAVAFRLRQEVPRDAPPTECRHMPRAFELGEQLLEREHDFVDQIEQPQLSCQTNELPAIPVDRPLDDLR